MGILHDQINATLRPGMHLPDALERLFTWIEANGLYLDGDDGSRIGLLFPDDELRAGWEDDRRVGGTQVSFAATDHDDLKYWFGHERPEVLERLCVFARTGSDGSMAAFWLDPHGQQHIVHMGSGSGSVLTCILANDALDFLRLLAIGYDEICWNEEFADPPNTHAEANGMYVEPNRAYQAWVCETFDTTIPRTAQEIVRHPDDMGQPDSQDAFNRWVEENAG